MTKKPESRLQQRIQTKLKQTYGSDLWIVKIYVGPFQQAGIPDLLCCLRGKFVALEVKMPGEEPSKIQIKTMKDIRYAGGIVATVTSPAEALLVLDSFAVSGDSGGLHPEPTGNVPVLRSRHGEDLCDLRSDRARKPSKPARLPSARRLP